ncbi:5-oxoprolinase subunit PxpA [Nostocoides sp. F2B08]|uniref:LamB/YcsF family protein n=1 Tax=Nostocoides sp. F2B08 TaxID=2653936 RepID=UPI001262F6B4|nr:5-oxoprolinase subunit PxpA [Tetrasphaera sp. F2B08]KAB7745611.1 5-oxoprolinase subunit PxpA [Tetrasphaera sp. F2B08]
MRIDLNSDLGESYGQWRLGDDEAMLDIVTSANVACGFHAGDALTLQETCRIAAERGVVVGAQVGYNHLAGFGRWHIDMPSPELTADVIYQIGALDGLCRVAGTRVSYVKPHGALYNTAAVDRRQAEAVVEAVLAYDAGLPLMGLSGSVLLDAAREAGLRTVAEAFADRAYTPEGRLVSRREPGAVLHEPDLVAERMVRLVTEGRVEAVDGTDVEVRADSVCVHGDSPGAVAMARAVRESLERAGAVIAPFAGDV